MAQVKTQQSLGRCSLMPVMCAGSQDGAPHIYEREEVLGYMQALLELRGKLVSVGSEEYCQGADASTFFLSPTCSLPKFGKALKRLYNQVRGERDVLQGRHAVASHETGGDISSLSSFLVAYDASTIPALLDQAQPGKTSVLCQDRV